MKKELLKQRIIKESLEWVKVFTGAIVFALLITRFVFFTAVVDGQSMEPTLYNGDRFIVWKLGYEPERGDIVILDPPQGYADDKKHWVKRVIATEGETVKIDYSTNSIYVDGCRLDEDYLGESMAEMSNTTEVTIPDDCVFVLGDNRNHSKDSRIVGPIRTDSILGKAVLRFWPFAAISTFGGYK